MCVADRRVSRRSAGLGVLAGLGWCPQSRKSSTALAICCHSDCQRGQPHQTDPATRLFDLPGRVEMWRGDGRSEHRCCRPFRLTVPYEPDHGSVSTPRSSVGSRTGAPTLGAGGCSSAFAVARSPAAIVTFPAPATSNGASGFPALRSPACFASRVTPASRLRGGLTEENRFVKEKVITPAMLKRGAKLKAEGHSWKIVAESLGVNYSALKTAFLRASPQAAV